MAETANARILVPCDSIIMGLPVQAILELCEHYGIKTENRRFVELKGDLLSLRRICDGRQEKVLHREVLSLYRNLSLKNFKDTLFATRIDLVMAIANHLDENFVAQ